MSRPETPNLQNRNPVNKPSNSDRKALSPLLTIRETAEYLNVSRSWLYREVELKRFPHLRLGKTIRFQLDSINAFLKKQKYSGAAI